MAESDRIPEIVVVCEARGDDELGTALADRVLVDQREWLDGILEGYRRWRGLDDRDAFLTWSVASKLATEHRIRAHGHFAGEPGAKDAVATRRTLFLLRKLIGQAFDAVVFLRDADKDPAATRRGLEQARAEWSGAETRPIVIGVASPMREAWVLAGFEPDNDNEQTALAALQTGPDALGLDPRTRSHELTAADELAKKNAKRVLRCLVGDDYTREQRCWQDAPLATLRERGKHNGLRAFLDEVEHHLLPVIDRSR